MVPGFVAVFSVVNRPRHGHYYHSNMCRLNRYSIVNRTFLCINTMYQCYNRDRVEVTNPISGIYLPPRGHSGCDESLMPIRFGGNVLQFLAPFLTFCVM
jgi:hypothetical protein